MWKEYYGGSAAQSSIVVAMDAAFSVKHDDPHSVGFLKVRLILSFCVAAFAAPTCMNAHCLCRLCASICLTNTERSWTFWKQELPFALRCHCCHLVRTCNRSVVLYVCVGLPCLRLVILLAGPDCNGVVNEFDACVAALAAFRAVHIGVVREYILKQQHPSKADVDTAGGKGTGGTGILEFLVPVHKETMAAKLYSV
jgi:hypothetical protein